MPRLGDTVAGLARRRGAAAPARGAGDPRLEEVREFGANPGGLRMLAYAPEGLPPGAPLVVVLHGCTQRASSYARAAGWLTLAARCGFAVLAPEQTAENNPNRCFNWFEPGDVARGAGEAASIEAMVRRMLAARRLDPGRVYVAGLSAGGAMAAALLAAYPEVFAGGAVVAGLPYGVARSAQQAFALMHGGPSLGSAELGALVRRAAPPPLRRPRLAVWHGTADGTVAPVNARALARQWAAALALPETPDETGRERGWTRAVWRDGGGRAQIELNLIAGLGHGTPLATRGPEGVGEAAPFMIETGVSSTLEILRFWEMAAEGRRRAAPTRPQREAAATGEGLGGRVAAAVSPHVTSEIKEVIVRALESAGLIR